MKTTVALRDQLKAGLIAGIAAGVLIELFLFATQLAGGTPLDQLPANFVFIAAVLLGPTAYTSAAAVPLGIVAHFCVAIGWAMGYAYIAPSKPQLLTRPWMSGAAYGLVVYIFMKLILVAAGALHVAAPGLTPELIAHIVFYGIPVAVIVSRMLRPSTSSG